jgi:hypothetical protein
MDFDRGEKEYQAEKEQPTSADRSSEPRVAVTMEAKQDAPTHRKTPKQRRTLDRVDPRG